MSFGDHVAGMVDGADLQLLAADLMPETARELLGELQRRFANEVEEER